MMSPGSSPENPSVLMVIARDMFLERCRCGPEGPPLDMDMESPRGGQRGGFGDGAERIRWFR
jgi:hypothetical protein